MCLDVFFVGHFVINLMEQVSEKHETAAIYIYARYFTKRRGESLFSLHVFAGNCSCKNYLKVSYLEKVSGFTSGFFPGEFFAHIFQIFLSFRVRRRRTKILFL